MVTQEQIQTIKNVIVQTVHPKKIYLFGSYAKGDADESSDLDLFIVMPDRTKKKYEVVNEINNKLFQAVAVPKDVVVDYNDRYEMFQSIPYSFIGHIVATGKLLYEN